MRIPSSTYRVQFNKDFRFADALALVPHLHDLGITDLYASPVLRARAGSPHGYDQVEPTRLNPELGSAEEFRQLTDELRRRGMGLLLDIVPNHMAASMDNPWWRNVLEHGRASPYASFFDIRWVEGQDANLQDRLLLPILGDQLADVLERQELQLNLDDDGFFVRYYDSRLPLDPATYAGVLEVAARRATKREAAFALSRLSAASRSIPPRTSTLATATRERQELTEALKQEIWRLYSRNGDARSAVSAAVEAFNLTSRRPGRSALLERLLGEQPYQLVYWRTGLERLNYRRFFDVTGLAAVRIESPRVFRAMHELVLNLAAEGRVTGFRIDHIDGLYDPLGYLRRLQHALGGDFYLVVEKILAGDEDLPRDWPVAGTTGYDFLNYLNGVFLDGRGVRKLGQVYDRMLGRSTAPGDITYEQQKRAMQDLFQAEIHALASQLARIGAGAAGTPDYELSAFSQALVEVSACLPVYRTYVRGYRISRRDRAYIERAVAEARRRSDLPDGLLDFVRRVLLLETPPGLTNRERRDWLALVMRWQQFTGPVMAKGVEDTSLYVYNRLISMNEVGSDPVEGAIGVARFHRNNSRRLRDWPHSLNATSTHDTKRSEDVRARIDVLTEIPAQWERRLLRWSELNRHLKWDVDGGPRPDANEEMLVYQTLLGVWPLDASAHLELSPRLKEYMVKACREAKVHTSWLAPDEEHESAVTSFIDAVLDEAESAAFLADFRDFVRVVAFHGALNSLSQSVLKIVSPGVPDFYQGTPLWDFSLVDPDNRRPVDFGRQRALQLDLMAKAEVDTEGLLPRLLRDWRSGAVKLFSVQRALHFRRKNPDLFHSGSYAPLRATGPRAGSVVALLRSRGDQWLLVAVPRFTTRLTRPEEWPLGSEVWSGTSLVLPDVAPRVWRNIYSGALTKSEGQATGLPLAEVFAAFPLALMEGRSPS